VPLAHSRRRVDFTGGSAMTVAHRLGRSGHRLRLDRHSQHRDLCQHAVRGCDCRPHAQLGVAGARLGPRSEGPAPARGP
jgi:hypothetical protein